jgi:hypothetical protein
MLLFPVRSIYSKPEYGSVMVDQKIVSDHEKCAIFVIAAEISTERLGVDQEGQSREGSLDKEEWQRPAREWY